MKRRVIAKPAPLKPLSATAGTNLLSIADQTHSTTSHDVARNLTGRSFQALIALETTLETFLANIPIISLTRPSQREEHLCWSQLVEDISIMLADARCDIEKGKFHKRLVVKDLAELLQLLNDLRSGRQNASILLKQCTMLRSMEQLNEAKQLVSTAQTLEQTHTRLVDAITTKFRALGLNSCPKCPKSHPLSRVPSLTVAASNKHPFSACCSECSQIPQATQKCSEQNHPWWKCSSCFVGRKGAYMLCPRCCTLKLSKSSVLTFSKLGLGDLWFQVTQSLSIFVESAKQQSLLSRRRNQFIARPSSAVMKVKCQLFSVATILEAHQLQATQSTHHIDETCLEMSPLDEPWSPFRRQVSEALSSASSFILDDHLQPFDIFAYDDVATFQRAPTPIVHQDLLHCEASKELHLNHRIEPELTIPELPVQSKPDDAPLSATVQVQLVPNIDKGEERPWMKPPDLGRPSQFRSPRPRSAARNRQKRLCACLEEVLIARLDEPPALPKQRVHARALSERRVEEVIDANNRGLTLISRASNRSSPLPAEPEESPDADTQANVLQRPVSSTSSYGIAPLPLEHGPTVSALDLPVWRATAACLRRKAVSATLALQNPKFRGSWFNSNDHFQDGSEYEGGPENDEVLAVNCNSRHQGHYSQKESRTPSQIPDNDFSNNTACASHNTHSDFPRATEVKGFEEQIHNEPISQQFRASKSPLLSPPGTAKQARVLNSVHDWLNILNKNQKDLVQFSDSFCFD